MAYVHDYHSNINPIYIMNEVKYHSTIFSKAKMITRPKYSDRYI